MCGIFGIWIENDVSGEQRISAEILNFLGRYAQLRGNDGYGIVLNGNITFRETTAGKKFTCGSCVKTDWALCNCRAKPETEPPTSYENIQPITIRGAKSVNNHIHDYDVHVVHNGSLSNEYVKRIYDEFNYTPHTKIDSEAFIPLFKNCLDMSEDEIVPYLQKAFSEVDGGFSVLASCLIPTDEQADNRRMFIAACKYQPLYELKVSFHWGDEHTTNMWIYHSLKKPLKEIGDWFENTSHDECSTELGDWHTTRRLDCFATYTLKEMKPYTFKVFYPRPYCVTHYFLKELEGGFDPKYVYPNRHKTEDKIKVLVAASSGIDSTTSLIMADRLLYGRGIKYDIEAVHFKYGHRGQKAEQNAIKTIVAKANKKFGQKFSLKIVQLEDIYKNFFNVKNSQLINEQSNVETGNNDKIKSTVAWVPVRNMLFQTLLFGLAETYILEQGYKDVYIVAGWNQLSEEGFYPDNSTRFSNAMSTAALFGTLTGKHIHNWNICSRLLKSDEWLLAKVYGFLDLFAHTISCDCPVNNNGTYYNCDGQCGSTILSQIASKRYIGIEDPRIFKHNPDITLTDKFKFYEEEPKEITDEVISEVTKRIVGFNE